MLYPFISVKCMIDSSQLSKHLDLFMASGALAAYVMVLLAIFPIDYWLPHLRRFHLWVLKSSEVPHFLRWYKNPEQSIHNGMVSLLTSATHFKTQPN